jgi:hypothetical protein
VGPKKQKPPNGPISREYQRPKQKTRKYAWFFIREQNHVNTPVSVKKMAAILDRPCPALDPKLVYETPNYVTHTRFDS